MKTESEFRYQLSDGDSFIGNQVIVTGVGADIALVFGEVISDSLDFGSVNPMTNETPENPLESLLLVNQMTMEYLTDYPSPKPSIMDSILGERSNPSDLEIHLYQIPENVPVEELIKALNDKAKASEPPKLVFAEYNYLVGHPGCVEGGPAGDSASAGGDLFWNQWALGEEGVGLFTGTGQNKVQSVPYTGAGVRVGVFDTSPFASEGGWTIPWIAPALNLCVSHLEPVVELSLDPDLSNSSDHGLFVSGLVHAVAPGSEIHLIRVLNEQGLGDLDTLVNALNLFIKKTLESNGTLENTVINLSLSVNLFPPPPGSEQNNALGALEAVLWVAHEHGALIVAAAGNDSKPEGGIEPTRFPASLPCVIGVAGSNAQGNRSCFSNEGDVAAPGGDKGELCELESDYCTENPDACLVGLAIPDSLTTGYVYWAGTSFSAPLVSGLHALMLGERKQGSEYTCPSSDPILSGGIVDLRHAFLNTPCSTPVPKPTP